jgi:hypothetical protein
LSAGAVGSEPSGITRPLATRQDLMCRKSHVSSDILPLAASGRDQHLRVLEHIADGCRTNTGCNWLSKERHSRHSRATLNSLRVPAPNLAEDSSETRKVAEA